MADTSCKTPRVHLSTYVQCYKPTATTLDGVHDTGWDRACPNWSKLSLVKTTGEDSQFRGGPVTMYLHAMNTIVPHFSRYRV